MTAWAASAGRGTAGGTSKEVLAARRLGRQLGNPLASLLATLGAADRLLSVATALPELAGEDPFATLRSLLKLPVTRSLERLQRSAPRGGNSVAEQRIPVRNASAHSRRGERPSGSEHASARGRAVQHAGSRDARSAAPAERSANPRPALAVARAVPSTPPHAASSVTPGRSQPPVATVSDALAQRRRRLRGSLDAISEAQTAAPRAVAAESIANRRSVAADAPLPAGGHAALAWRDVAPAAHALLDGRNGVPVSARGNADTPLTSPDSEALHAEARAAFVPGTIAAPDRERSALLAAPSRPASPSAHTPSAAVTSTSQDSVSSKRTRTRELLQARTQAAVLPDTPVDTVIEAAYRNGVDLT